jgi:plastocyanin
MKRLHFLSRNVLPLVLCGMMATTAPAAEYLITIAKMKFSAPPAELRVGDVIRWRNDDIFRHTATARDKSFDVDLPPKSEGSTTLSTEGEIEFFCRFHPAMKGTLDVRP